MKITIGQNTLGATIGQSSIGATVDSRMILSSDNEARETLNPLISSWSLLDVPARPDLSRFYINGQKQWLGIDYVINGNLVNWLGYTLQSHWLIDIYYR